jgi:hypothetical protein
MSEVHACPSCGRLCHAFKCECPDGPHDPVSMPDVVAARLRILTDECERSGVVGGRTVRVYRHAGVQFNGMGPKGAFGFSRDEFFAVARLVLTPQEVAILASEPAALEEVEPS